MKWLTNYFDTLRKRIVFQLECFTLVRATGLFETHKHHIPVDQYCFYECIDRIEVCSDT